MSILIKGMEMPTSCDFCPISLPHVEELGCGFDLEHCPITEVPPHGRLIDADAVISMLEEMAKGYPIDSIGGYWISKFSDMLKAAPTIIPAEEGE